MLLRFFIFLLTCVSLQAGSITAINLYPAYIDPEPHSGNVTFTYTYSNDAYTITKSSGSTWNPGVSNWNSNAFIIVTFDGGGSSGFNVSNNDYPGIVVCPPNKGATILIGIESTVLFSFHLAVPTALEDQNIIANNLAGSAYKGSTITGHASGKASGSVYSITVISSSGGASINEQTGDYVLTPSTVGQLNFQISASASSGYKASNTLVGSFDVKESNKFKYTIPFNNGKFDIKYELWQGDTKLGEYIVKPGDGGTISTLDLAANDLPVTVKSFIIGVASDGVNTITDGTSQLLSKVETFTPQSTDTPTTQKVAAPPVSSVIASTPEAISERSGTVWSKPTTTATGTNQTPGQGDGLTNQVYREGVGKVVDKLEQIELSKIQDNEKSQKSASDSFSGALEAARSASSSMAATIPTAGAFPSGPNIPASSAQDFTVKFPGIFGGLTVDLDPLRADRLGPTAAWLRGAFYWLTIVGFGYWASNKVGEWVKGASQLQQTRGNTVAGTGGQITAAIGAAIIVVAISTFIVALVGYLAGDFSISAILSKMTVNPMAGYSAKALYLLDGVFPIATIITALVARISWNLYASSTFAGAMAFIRFINP